MDRASTPSLRAVINRAIENHADGLRVALPARVEAYDPVRQCVDVQPLIQTGYRDENGDRQVERMPMLLDVPLAFLGGRLNRMTVPIVVGDSVLLLFCSSSIARWKLLGGEVDPGDDRRHDLNDSIAIPGLHDFAHVPTTAPMDAMVLHADQQLRLGGPGANDPVVRRSDLDAVVSGFNSLLATHVHSGGTLLGGLTGTAAVTGVSTPACSAKVKAE